MNGPIIFGKDERQFLADLGTALLQVKNARGLTLVQMGHVVGRGDDMFAKYIAGESEMGVLAWQAANEAWPELADKLAETAAEREFRARQRILDLPNIKRSAA